jgi:phosphosulfolactate synthase
VPDRPQPTVPDFLALPRRAAKPRTAGVTHMLDKGSPVSVLEGYLASAGDHVDIIKIGWGISYVDRAVRDRIAVCKAAGVLSSLGGTLLEIAAAQGRVTELVRWAKSIGVDCVEVSNGLERLTLGRKRALVHSLAGDFIVLAEAGAKDAKAPVAAAAWAEEMTADLEAGARWVIAEGRESGTVGLFEPDGSVRVQVVDGLARLVGFDRIIFEAPRKTQQMWFITRFGSDVNLGNIPPEELLPLETLRLGLRADTAPTPMRAPVAPRLRILGTC